MCPHCSSRELTFLEHGSGISVYVCQACARTTVERHAPAPTVAFEAPPKNDFRFPSWFNGRA
jgi:DNA-directed RNA polymerase subunit RPC12/RpoP